MFQLNMIYAYIYKYIFICIHIYIYILIVGKSSCGKGFQKCRVWLWILVPRIHKNSCTKNPQGNNLVDHLVQMFKKIWYKNPLHSQTRHFWKPPPHEGFPTINMYMHICSKMGIYMYVYVQIWLLQDCYICINIYLHARTYACKACMYMGWLRLVGSLKL